MADVKISALPATSSLQPTDIIPVVTDPSGAAATKKITYQDFLNFPPARWQLRLGTTAASANNLTLPTDGNAFFVSGTTTINTINTSGWIAGSQIVLIFQDTLTVTNNGSGTYAPVYLSKTENFVTQANTVLQMIFDGTVWQEMSRKSPA